MVKNFILLSLPKSAKPENSDKVGSSATNLTNWLVSNGIEQVHKLAIPDFKIGSLDSLVLQSDELTKIDDQLSNSIGKIVEILSILFGNEYLRSNRKINDEISVEDYLCDFKWNVKKFRLDKSLKDLIEMISQESFQLDSDVKTVFNNYNTAKTNLTNAERKQNGDLSVRNLNGIVSKKDFVLDSEHLQTILVAVPKALNSEFLNKYESLTKFVVPRSAKLLQSDPEFHLYTVTLFKKYISEYQQALRENKFIPREFIYSDEVLNSMQKEYENARQAESQLKSDLILLTKTAYSDILSNWFHLKIIKVFIESILRYGLPPDFNSVIIKVANTQQLASYKKTLYLNFGYLGGSAFSLDKHGKLLNNDSSLNEYASLVDTDYEPFVFYPIEIK